MNLTYYRQGQWSFRGKAEPMKWSHKRKVWVRSVEGPTVLWSESFITLTKDGSPSLSRYVLCVCVTVRILVCDTLPLRLKLLPKIRNNTEVTCLTCLVHIQVRSSCSSDVTTGTEWWLCLIYWRSFCTTSVCQESRDRYLDPAEVMVSRVSKVSLTSFQGFDPKLFVPGER
jgi:hypothetical protein